MVGFHFFFIFLPIVSWLVVLRLKIRFAFLLFLLLRSYEFSNFFRLATVYLSPVYLDDYVMNWFTITQSYF